MLPLQPTDVLCWMSMAISNLSFLCWKLIDVWFHQNYWHFPESVTDIKLTTGFKLSTINSVSKFHCTNWENLYRKLQGRAFYCLQFKTWRVVYFSTSLTKRLLHRWPGFTPVREKSGKNILFRSGFFNVRIFQTAPCQGILLWHIYFKFNLDINSTF